MRRAIIRALGGLALGLALLLAGCQAQKSATKTTIPAPAPAPAPKQEKAPVPEAPAPVASAQVTGSGAVLPLRVDMDSLEDCVDWSTVPEGLRPADPYEGARELPGERLGLTGPIIAKSTSAKKPYIVVYDSAGALVGGLLLEEVRKEPDRLEFLLQRAMERCAIQNRMALEVMRVNGRLEE
ncbi:hypothetical protein [Salidesulfovibrio onnuriiensis]|uniref:hypothetical protein n=1 Tax=Salidesulfovibrio onnuriiensis TaxID=2583823 RepID=UPI0011C7C240|nr:hypothetical protein [Salidesulfovibrio onnuriiensis]